MPVNVKRLRVLYNFGMDDDADDRLELPIEIKSVATGSGVTGSGAAGRVWHKHEEIVCDLEDARSTFKKEWQMNKYQQAMVRKELCSLLCVPIFDENAYDPTKKPESNPIIGVLGFDSDEKLLLEFASPDVQEKAKKLARVVAKKLKY